MTSIARKVPAENWPDDTKCPNCGGRNILEFAYPLGPRPERTCVECRDCGAYSEWRPVSPEGEPDV